jgi:hypothetical protein
MALIADKQQDSTDWFIGKARSAAGYRKKILSNTDRARDSTVIGKMYFFAYDPKFKNTLPMYDRFPLVFPIEGYSDGFLGLNLHYLAPAQRTTLLNMLSGFSSNQRLDKTTKLRLSYDLLSQTKKLASASRPCIKRYLFSQVRSDFIEITAAEWYKAIELPVAMFEYN